MTELVALLSTGKGTWTEVIRLMNGHEWDKIILITNEFGKENFKPKENTELIVINFEESIEMIIDHLIKQLKDRITGTEVALNLASGAGKEHMALLSSLLKLGVGIRLITYSINNIKEL